MKSRRIYTSGKSQVLAVPSDWYERIKAKLGDANMEVLVRSYGDLLLVLPMFEYPEKKMPITLEVTDYDEMECDLKSHYMFGKDRVMLKVPSTDEHIERRLEEVRKKLYGMSYVRENKNTITVDFNLQTVPVTELLDREFNLYNEMQTESSHQLEIFPQIGERSSKNTMETLENEVDKTSYQAKRSLVKALYDPTMILDLGLKHFADVFGYYRIEENFERLADLQRQIFVEIQDLKFAYKQLPVEIDLNRLVNFYMKAHDLVQRSYRDPENRVASVIRSKTRHAERGEPNTAYDDHEQFVEWLIGDGISGMITKKKYGELSKEESAAYNKIIKSLWHLESRVYGMVGNASNIAESRLLMQSRNYLFPKQ